MKFAVVFAILVLSAVAVSAQSSCRQGDSQILEHRSSFTIQSVSLQSPTGPLSAKALIPDRYIAGDPAVFTFSKLLVSKSQQSVNMMPIAIELAKHGEPSIVIERQLTWPAEDENVETVQSAALCAEQWLSTHAAIRPHHWRFIGPERDVPTLDQARDLGDTISMTFLVSFPMGGTDDMNTKNALRNGFAPLDFLLQPFIDGY